MPVEIRELSIKINLSDEGGTSGTNANGGNAQEAQQALVEMIAEKVLEILRNNHER